MNLPPAGSSLHFFAMSEIRLFMSGYQRHFWISARHATEALFRALDKELHVELFLVGILREDTADRHTVCLEPEDCGFDPAQFSGVKEETAQQSHDWRLINRSSLVPKRRARSRNSYLRRKERASHLLDSGSISS